MSDAEKARNALAALLAQRIAFVRDLYGRLPQSPIDDRRRDPREELGPPGMVVPADWPWRKYSGLLASGHTLPPADLNNPLAQQAGVRDIAQVREPPPTREVWVPPGKEVNIPVETLRDLYGPGDITITARTMPGAIADQSTYQGEGMQ